MIDPDHRALARRLILGHLAAKGETVDEYFCHRIPYKYPEVSRDTVKSTLPTAYLRTLIAIPYGSKFGRQRPDQARLSLRNSNRQVLYWRYPVFGVDTSLGVPATTIAKSCAID